MKTRSLILFSLLFFMCQSPINGIDIPIKVYGKGFNTLVPNVTLHTNKDVEIFRSDDKSDEDRTLYSCIIYRNDNGILRGYQVYTSELIKYERATYHWVNDSTVTFILKNVSHNSEKYTISGYGGATSLSVD